MVVASVLGAISVVFTCGMFVLLMLNRKRFSRAFWANSCLIALTYAMIACKLGYEANSENIQMLITGYALLLLPITLVMIILAMTWRNHRHHH